MIAEGPATSLRDAYVDLVKRSITNYVHLGSHAAFDTFDTVRHYDGTNGAWTIAPEARPMTLLSKPQLDLVETLVLDVERRGVPGDYIEAGVWRGGAVAFLRALIRAYDIPDRMVVAADTFAGIPVSERFPHDLVNQWSDRWVATIDDVRQGIDRLGLLDTTIDFLPGAFAGTLPTLAGRRFALIRLDADAYDSTETALRCLYPLLSEGGAVIIDDWHLVGCKLAVETFRTQHGVDDPITVTAGNAHWIKRGADGSCRDRPGAD